MQTELDWQQVKELQQTKVWPHPAWAGTTKDDKSIFIQYQFGYLSVALQGFKETGLYSHPEAFGIQFGEKDDNEMETEEMLEATGIVLLP